MSEKKDKLVTLKVDDDLLTAFKKICADNDMTVSQVLRASMREYVAKHKQQKLDL